jgi:hypothetical protein
MNKITGLILGSLLISTPAFADLLFDQELIYFNSALTGSSTDSSALFLGSFSVGATFYKDMVIGWTVNSMSRSSASGGATSSLSGIEMGPRIGVFINKAQTMDLTFTYLPLVNMTHTASDGTTGAWQGTGIQAELGFMPQITNSLFAGFKLMYHSMSFSKSTNSANLTSEVSYSQSNIIPVIAMSWRF